MASTNIHLYFTVPVHSYCYICLLTTFLLVKLNTGLFSTALEDNCGRLKYKGFHSEHCELCSFCSPEQRHYHNYDCKNKNPNDFDNGTFLWCSDPNGLFPECKPLPPVVNVTNCSSSCTENRRQFAPECVCSAHCGELSFHIRCTEEVSWNVSELFIYDTCKRSGTVATVASVPTFATAKSGDDVNHVLVGLIVTAVVIVILTAAAAVLILQKKCRKVQKTPQSSNSSTSDETERSSQPLVGESRNTKILEPTQPFFTKDVNELEALHYSKEAPERQVPCGQNKEMQTCVALQALLVNREAVITVCMLFDQEYSVHLITWHSIARKLLKMAPGSITHNEYCKRPVLSGSPGDGPTFSVLQDMHKQGISLCDLIKWLKEPEQSVYLNANQAVQTLQELHHSLLQKKKIISHYP